MPDAEVIHTSSCVPFVRFLEDLMAQANGPKVTEIDAGSEEKKLPVMVTSVPPAVDPSTGSTEDTCGVNEVRTVKTADWCRIEAETDVVCVSSRQPLTLTSLTPYRPFPPPALRISILRRSFCGGKQTTDGDIE